LLQIFGSSSTPILENPEFHTRWYFKYFLGKSEYPDALNYNTVATWLVKHVTRRKFPLIGGATAVSGPPRK
jgi:hypothetical protein